MNTIIVGTDGSDRSAPAVEWAADEAVRRGGIVHIVHTVPWLYDTPVDPRAGVVPKEVIARGQKILDRAVATARERGDDVKVQGELMVGPASRILLERADGAAMVVVGAHGRGLLPGVIPGSTALQVVMHAQVPTVVVRRPDTVTRNEIVLGVDGRKAEEPAIRFAFEEAALRRARLHVIHVWSHPESNIPGGMQPLAYDPAIIADEERTTLDAALAGWREKFPEVDVVAEVVQGHTARILAGASARSDLLVVGTRGRGGFTGLLLGSVSHAMLHHAHCPVAVVPSTR